MAESEPMERKKSVSVYIEKAKNVAKNTAKNLVENLEKVTAHAKKPETDLETKETNADSMTILAKVSVNNPYNIDIHIVKATYDFIYDGKNVAGNLKILQEGRLLKAKTKDNKLDVPVKVPQSSLTIQGNDHDHMHIDYKLRMNLTIEIPVIGQVNIPVSGEGKFARPTTAATTMHMSDFLSDQVGLQQIDDIREEEVEKKVAGFRP